MRTRSSSNEASRPLSPGAIPRRSLLVRGASLAFGVAGAHVASGLFGGSLLAGCGTPRDARTLGVYTVAITPATPASVDGEEASVFQVGRSIPLPIKERPRGLPATKPYPGTVAFTPSDLRVQLSYVVSNLEDRDIQIALLVDVWNEFVFYSPQVRVVEDAVVADRSSVDRKLIVPAKGRVTGRVSYDDFERAAIALATIENKAPNPFHVLEPSTNLYESPLSAPYVPGIISGITGFDLSLRAGEAARVAVEGTVELLDLNEILVPDGEVSPNRRRETGRRALIPVVATETG